MSFTASHGWPTASLALLILACGGADSTSGRAPAAVAAAAAPGPSGPYVGQEPPGAEPRLFAPGFISTGLAERDVAMNPAGDELYYTTVLGAGFDMSAILVTRQVDGYWTTPQVASFSGRYKDLEPAISPAGDRFFFVSNRPLPGSSEPQENEDIWWLERRDGAWGEPQPIGAPINTDAAEFFPSITRTGTLYFTRREPDRTESIYRSSLVEGVYQEPQRLGPEVNGAPTQFNAFIDPDERYLIVCSWGREDSLGGVDYYVSFRSPADMWTGPINLGPAINTATGQEWSPYVSPDGRYLFFMSSRASIGDAARARPFTAADFQRLHGQPMNGNSDIWWVDASILERLRPADLN